MDTNISEYTHAHTLAANGLILGIDASRNRSGGAITHLIGMLNAAQPQDAGISHVHVWSYDRLLSTLPTRPWMTLHNPKELERGLAHQVYWQRRRFPVELTRRGCSIVLNTDAGTVCRFRPAVTMSRDMLSYEPGEIQRYGISRARLRLWLLRHMQNRSLRMADGVIFLTHYAARVIQSSCGPLNNFAVVPHGVSDAFRDINNSDKHERALHDTIQCIYVSNTAPYKHQGTVVRAIESLRFQGYPLSLTLVGGGSGRVQAQLNCQIRSSDPEGRYIQQLPFVSHDALPQLISDADVFIFASSCENMPNTLVEGMCAGLPIACSDRGPMPEVLKDGGVYFDPESHLSIAEAVKRIIDAPSLRQAITARSRQYAAQYSWARCAAETLRFLTLTYTHTGQMIHE